MAMTTDPRRRCVQQLTFALFAAVCIAHAAPLHAQRRGPRAAPSPAPPVSEQAHATPTARQQAPFDLTGFWVSLVTADWRFRMVVPGRGEYAGIPINDTGKTFADQWTRAADEAAGKQCEAYGAGVVMVVPERLHIAWTDAETLQVQTDAGMQTRVFHFARTPPESQPASWQGYSTARWLLAPTEAPAEAQPFAISAGAPPTNRGQLEVDTSHLLPGLLRKNGVPYSAQATVVEYWELHTDPESQMQVAAITVQVTDPKYLAEPYVYTALFQKQSDDTGWDPQPCSLTW